MGAKGFNQLKVYQLGGIVADRACYHHGNDSMNGTIIGMAQDYPGCGNNIPLLKDHGQFGSRIENGEDAGAPRYISCSLNKITRLIFPAADDSLMTRKCEDNEKVEPYYYAPIIPMILVNGAKGIGTGWSTDIPSFNPKEIIQYVKAKILLEDLNPIHSYYKNFFGKITEHGDRWNYHGIVEKINSTTYRVTELPIRYSTTRFISRLNYLVEIGNLELIKNVKKRNEKSDELLKTAKKQKAYWTPNPVVKTFTNHSTVEKINFDIIFDEPITPEEVISALGLVQSIKNTNMVAFDSENMITKFNNITEIINEWYKVRYNIYELRIKKMIDELKFEIKMAANKLRFIEENIKKIIDVKNIPKAKIISTLEERKYDKLPTKEQITVEDEETVVEVSFDYLLNMKIYSLTKEKYENLKRKLEELHAKLKEYEELCVEELWINDLEELEKYIGKIN